MPANMDFAGRHSLGGSSPVGNSAGGILLGGNSPNGDSPGGN